MFVSQVAQTAKQVDLCPDVQMQGGFVQQQYKRLLCQRASQHDSLFFSAGDFVHPAITQMLGAYLRQRLFGDGKILVFLEPERSAVGMTSLQDIITGKNGENEGTLLLHERDALGTGSRIEMAGLEAVKFHAAGKRNDGAGDQAEQRGFAAGVRTEDGHEFALARLKGGGFEREERRRLLARRIGIAGLFDVDAYVRRVPLGGGPRTRFRNASCSAHASLRRSR